MRDTIIKAVTGDGNLRVTAAVTTTVVQKARDYHNLYPVPTAALGRLLTGGLLMAADYKNNERINLRIDGDGPIGQILVDAGYGEARGYVSNPEANLPLNARGKLDVAGVVGKGKLYVVKDLGLKEPWNSSVNLVSGEIAEDIAYYFSHSEQIPSAVALGVEVTPEALVSAAGGFIVQVMPGCPEAKLELMETRVGGITSVTGMVKDMETPERMASWLLEDMEPQILDQFPAFYECKCSRDRMARALISLGRDDLTQLLAEPGDTETICHFCNKRYIFTNTDIRELVPSL